jgi:hypothetical protein
MRTKLSAVGFGALWVLLFAIPIAMMIVQILAIRREF